MTREEAKEIFLNRGFVNGLFNGDKWRQSIVVISKWLEQEPCEDYIKIPEGATNGEVLKNVLKETFPEMICVWYRDSEHLHRSITFSEDWWNSPYREETE